MKPVAHLSEANLELIEAARWYDGREAGLGDRFLGAVKAAETLMQCHPEWGTPNQRRTRKWTVPDFPYQLVYREETDRILVLAFAHGKKRQGYWTKRIK